MRIVGVGKAITLRGTNAILMKYEAYSQAHFILIQAQQTHQTSSPSLQRFISTQMHRGNKCLGFHPPKSCKFALLFIFLF